MTDEAEAHDNRDEIQAAKAYNRYTQTSYSGRRLLEKHPLSTYGIWHVRGEDPNCDLGGFHHQPSLGYFEGTLDDVIRKAVSLSGFFTWGGGGSIELQTPPLVTKV